MTGPLLYGGSEAIRHAAHLSGLVVSKLRGSHPDPFSGGSPALAGPLLGRAAADLGVRRTGEVV
ncbi:hypothetical protein [Schaalia hyovaginalis]|uniref:Uncharacterized protein n=1 Tax=Schaalia hyovaginalis TaxID=29316 RepID=A0A923IY86_9ACTO|nr:hypothetical protein [Schaalia hyovaginalis]MBB6334101.1 hypothetical protein [Schaalia hyovaginalis]